MKASTRDRLQQLTAHTLDWSLVTALADEHAVTPLVYHHLTAEQLIGPSDDCAALRQRSLANAGNSLVLTQELIHALRLLEEAGIRAIPYKGPALAAHLYGSIALRQFSDLDVLVKPSDARRAKAVLVENGYEPEFVLTGEQERNFLRTRTEYFWRLDRRNAAGRIPLELHWRIPSTFSLDLGFWDRLRPMRLLDVEVPQFSQEDLLLILCAHGFKHGWDTLVWICDVAEILGSSSELDWRFVFDQARRMGGARILLLGCAMAHAVLEIELAPPVATLIENDPAVSSLAHELQRHLVGQTLDRVGLKKNLMIRERPRDKFFYALDLAVHLTSPTPAERTASPLTGGAGFSQYLGYPLRLARRVSHKWRR